MQVLTTALPPPTGGDRPHVVPVPRLRAAPRAGLGDPRQAYRIRPEWQVRTLTLTLTLTLTPRQAHRIRPEWQVRAQDERRSACKCLPRRLAPHLDPHRCVPKMSVDQIKAKFRYQQTVRRKQQLASAAGSVRPSTCCGLPCGLCESDETWWDRMLGIDVFDGAHDVDFDGAHDGAHAGQPDGVVDEARKARVKQLRKERLPEATLLPIVHSKEAHLEGKLQIHGDPSSMYMML